MMSEVEISNAHDIHAVRGHEQAKYATDSRIYIENLVTAVTGIIAIADSHQALVPDGFKKTPRGTLDGLVALALDE